MAPGDHPTGMAGTAAAVSQSVAQIRARFQVSLAERVQELDGLMMLAEQESDPSPYLGKAAQIVHRMAGVARTLGFPVLGDLSFEAEHVLDQAVAKGSKGADLAAALDAIEKVIAEIDTKL